MVDMHLHTPHMPQMPPQSCAVGSPHSVPIRHTGTHMPPAWGGFVVVCCGLTCFCLWHHSHPTCLEMPMQSCAVDPGAVSSNIYANSRLPSPIRWFIRNMHAPTQDGASAVLHAATTPWPAVTTPPAQQYKPQPRELRVSCAQLPSLISACSAHTWLIMSWQACISWYLCLSCTMHEHGFCCAAVSSTGTLWHDRCAQSYGQCIAVRSRQLNPCNQLLHCGLW